MRCEQSGSEDKRMGAVAALREWIGHDVPREREWMFALWRAAVPRARWRSEFGFSVKWKGLSQRPARCGGAKPPADQAAAGGPRGQALSLTRNATNRGAASGHTTLLRTTLLYGSMPQAARSSNRRRRRCKTGNERRRPELATGRPAMSNRRRYACTVRTRPTRCTVRGGSAGTADIERKDEALQDERINEDAGENAPPSPM